MICDARLQRLVQYLQVLPAGHKRTILIATDAAVGASAVMVTATLMLPFDHMVALAVLAGILMALVSILLGLDRVKLNAFLHGGILRSLAAAGILALGFGGWLAVTGNSGIAGPSALMFPVLVAFAGLVLSRAVLLRLLLAILEHRHTQTRVLIYGAGTTGAQLAAALQAHETVHVVGFLDDDPSLWGRRVAGLRVHGPAAITALAARHRIDRVLLAMPSLPAAKRLRVSRGLIACGLEVHALPSFAQLAGTGTLCDHLAPISTDDVLGRTELAWDLDRHAGAYRGRTIMVTGAGGSVGAELCRQLLALGPRRLVLFELGEFALYALHRELTALPRADSVDIRPVLGSVTDAACVRDAISDHGIEVILHAAAYKHVPLVETNPLAGLHNNAIGTWVLADAARAAGVSRFILISTDKALRPANMMGASKRLAELVVRDMARRPGRTAFSIVRFGNVMGSSGSVIPLFREQIAAGGPVTLTHDDVTRYFMSLAEAAQLVLLAGAQESVRGGGSGDILALDMGAPIRIRDLAARMVAAAGLTVRDRDNPEGDIEILIIGLRPGEKLQEDALVTPGMMTTPHPKILRAVEPPLPMGEVAGILQALQDAIRAGDADLARLVVDAAVGPRSPAENTAPFRNAHRARG
ncbi:MAG: nucleoside-diphosphate sugar epimerase/dehydratase [Pseudomonadota bacterium]